MRTVRLTVAAVALLSSACATTIAGSAENITRLEQARDAHPGSEDAVRTLGIAYFKAKRYADARAALEHATSMNQRDGVAALYLGLTAEAENDLPAARAAYETYLQVGKTRRVRTEIQNRLAALRLEQIQLAAQQELAHEADLASVAGPPNTIAVMPFHFTGSDTTLEPIERGFAELVTTDLSRVSALTVVERIRLQALLNEMSLQQDGVTRQSTANQAERAGKILRVGKMVGGSLDQTGDQLQASAFVTDISTQLQNPTTDTQSLEQLFTLEKDVVFGVLNTLHVTPTTAERNAIEQQPTKSLAAFLAYSHGLELEDAGRFEDANRFFDNAVRIDPSFGSAEQKAQETKRASAGAQVTVSTVESGLRGTTEGSAASISTNVVSTAVNVADNLNPSPESGATTGGGSTSTQPQKEPLSGTGADNVTTKQATVTITIGQPGKP